MPEHRGIDACITVDGVPLDEYGGEVDAGNKRMYNCFVASEAGKVFELRVDCEPSPEYIWSIRSFVDGTPVGSRLAHGDTKRIKGFPAGLHASHQFVFTDIALTDDDDATQGSDEIGTIYLHLFRVVPIGDSVDIEKDSFVLPDIAPLQEKSKKLGGHRAGAGKYEWKYRRGRQTRRFDPDDPNPFVIFKFVYRPKEMLRAQGILPPHLHVKRELDEETEDGELARLQLEILERRIRMDELRRKRVKRES